jgi:TonB family protein
MSTRTGTESTWRAPDLLLSIAGHVLVVVIAAVLGVSHAVKDTRRPIVFNVAVVSAGSPLAASGESEGTTLVEAKPKAQAKARPKVEVQAKTESKPGTKTAAGKGGGKFGRPGLGLGARIEGAEALGYSYYLNVILTRISDNWMNPYAGEAKTLNATVMFVIERDGTVKDVKIEKKSGDASYDASCERALLVLDRLPQLPPEFTGPRLKLHLEFEQKP